MERTFPGMRIRTLFFASYKELVGTGELWLDLDGDGDRRTGPAVQYLHLASEGRVAPGSRVNRTYAAAAHPLAEGDELAFIPPVAGG